MLIKVRINKRELLASGLLCLLGLAVALQVSASAVGRLPGLGAGLLPVLMGTLLMLVGILWLFNSRLSPDEEEDAYIGSSKWRGSCGPVSAVFAFMLFGRYLGLVPAIFALVFITVLGDHRHTWRSAGLLAGLAALAASAVLFFHPGLSLSLLGMQVGA